MHRPPTLPTVAALAALAAAVATAAPLPRPAGAQDRSDHRAPREATVDARGARRLDVDAHAGELRITGVAGLAEVRVRGTARASDRALLDAIRVVAVREGDVVVVRAEIPETRDDGRWDDDRWRALDLVLEVPAGIAADVRDGSGEARIRGLGALRVRDGSGELEIEDVASAVIEDGSGELRVRNVRGDVRIDDGSGSIEAERVGGAVIVEDDGSGSVSVRDVGGDFRVDRGRASRIRYSDVRGRVDVPTRRR